MERKEEFKYQKKQKIYQKLNFLRPSNLLQTNLLNSSQLTDKPMDFLLSLNKMTQDSKTLEINKATDNHLNCELLIYMGCMNATGYVSGQIEPFSQANKSNFEAFLIE